MKQAARRPRPPLPRPGSYSASMISWAENPRSLTALLNWSSVRREQRVLELLAHEELSGQVAHGLGVAVDHVGLGLHPGIHEMATHCGGRGDVHVGRLGLLDGDALGVLQLLTNLVSELFRGDRGLRCVISVID